MPRPVSNYDSDFRQNAVNLLLSSGRRLKRVAAELGVSPSSLRNWRDKALGERRATECGPAQPGARSGAPLAVADPAAKIRRLHKEIEYLKRQREILKKP